MATAAGPAWQITPEKVHAVGLIYREADRTGKVVYER